MKSRPSGHKLLHSVTVIAKSATDTPPHPPPQDYFYHKTVTTHVVVSFIFED